MSLAGLEFDESAPLPLARHAARDASCASTLCLVPEHLAPSLCDLLERHFAADDGAVTVLVEQRRGERRRRLRRGATLSLAPTGGDRRRVNSETGRRMFERRGVTAPAKAPTLPRRARRHVAELCFVETIQHSPKRVEDADSARLVAEFQLGNQGAFSTLYQRYFDDIYGYLRMLLCDHHEAEDATQQAFTKAFMALPAFQLRTATPFRAWLFRIARNEALGHLRKAKRVDVEDPEIIDGRRNGPELALPHDALGWLSDSQLIGLIERLPAAQRQTLALRYIVGMQTSEMAEVLGKSAQAIRKLEHRALRHLEERMTPTRQAAPSRLQRVGMLMRLRRAPVLGSRRFALALSQHPASMRARRSW